jgi:hypothetical protein
MKHEIVLCSSCDDFTLENEFKKMTDRMSLISAPLTDGVSKKNASEETRLKQNQFTCYQTIYIFL